MKIKTKTQKPHETRERHELQINTKAGNIIPESNISSKSTKNACTLFSSPIPILCGFCGKILWHEFSKWIFYEHILLIFSEWLERVVCGVVCIKANTIAVSVESEHLRYASFIMLSKKWKWTLFESNVVRHLSDSSMLSNPIGFGMDSGKFQSAELFIEYIPHSMRHISICSTYLFFSHTHTTCDCSTFNNGNETINVNGFSTNCISIPIGKCKCTSRQLYNVGHKNYQINQNCFPGPCTKYICFNLKYGLCRRFFFSSLS